MAQVINNNRVVQATKSVREATHTTFNNFIGYGAVGAVAAVIWYFWETVMEYVLPAFLLGSAGYAGFRVAQTAEDTVTSTGKTFVNATADAYATTRNTWNHIKSPIVDDFASVAFEFSSDEPLGDLTIGEYDRIEVVIGGRAQALTKTNKGFRYTMDLAVGTHQFYFVGYKDGRKVNFTSSGFDLNGNTNTVTIAKG